MLSTDQRPPTLNSLVVDCGTKVMCSFLGIKPESIEALLLVQRLVNKVVMGTHPYVDFDHPVLGPCRLHSLSGAAQQEYVYVIKTAKSRARMHGMITEILNTAIAKIVEDYERAYPDYAPPYV